MADRTVTREQALEWLKLRASEGIEVKSNVDTMSNSELTEEMAAVYREMADDMLMSGYEVEFYTVEVI